MTWKLVVFLTFLHYMVKVDGALKSANDVHWQLLETTFHAPSVDTPAADEDVGEPLILTPYIEDNRLHEARVAARVNDSLLVPGVESYAGYLTVNKEHNGNLWFWYFPIANKSVEETPLIIWLQGGPGASSLYGLFVEIGPFAVTDNNTLKENKYSWGNNHSLLFIDNPVGTGYSFTDEDGYATNQTTIGENLYTALQQFLTIFPELRKAPLFIVGESYAGKHVPSLGIQIMEHEERDAPINLQGLAIGNGFVDPITLLRYSYFAREVGLVDDVIADIIKGLEANVTQYIKNGDMEAAFELYNDLLGVFQTASHLSNPYNYLADSVELSGSYAKFIQRPEMRRALHVGSTKYLALSRKVYEHLMLDIMNSAKPWLQQLLGRYRVLVYNGHLDCMVPYHASVNTYKSLQYPEAEEYNGAERSPWTHEDVLAGYVKVGGRLTEVMVRGAGHMAPADRPAQARALLAAFVRDVPIQDT